MLDHSKLVIISADHNHLPPFLTRNDNGMVTSYSHKPQPRQRRERATLGPRATRYEVDCLVASIMQEMEYNRKQPTEPPVETEVAPSNNSVAPTIVIKEAIAETGTAVSDIEALTSEDKTSVKTNERLPKNKIDISSLKEKTHQNEFASYVYHSATNRTRALTKLMAGTLGSEPTSLQTNVLKTCTVRHEPDSLDSSHKPLVNPVEENPIVATTGVDVPIKQEPGILSNQMYIVIPPTNNDAGKIMQNRFIIPSTQNTGGIMYNNKILLSPVKTEVNSETSGFQAKRNEPCGLAGNILNKDSNAGTTNKMFIVLRSNDGGCILQNYENVTKMTDKVPNKMFILVHNKNEKDIAVAPTTDALTQPDQNTAVSVSSSIISPTATTAFDDLKRNQLITQKTVLKTSIPISSIKNVILPPKTDGGCAVISKNIMSSKKPDGVSVAGPSKLNLFLPKSLNLSSNINITSASETGNQLPMRGETSTFIPRLPIKIQKKTETVNILRKKAQSIMPMKNNIMTQTLPSDLILDGKKIRNNQIKNIEAIISGGSPKIADNEGNILQENSLDVETEVFSMLPLKSQKKVQNTYEMQSNMQHTVTKIIKTDRPGCNTQQNMVLVKTEAGTLEVSDKTQKNLSIKTETDCESFKEDIETGIVALGTPIAIKQQLIIPDDEAQIIHSVSYNKQPMVSTAAEGSMDIHLTPMIKDEIIKVSYETQLTTTHKDQPKTLGHSKSQDDLLPVQNIKFISPATTKANETPMKIDLDWIVPRNKDAVQPKINTNLISKDLKEMTDNTFDFGKISNVPEMPIPISMIPLPNESTSLVSTTSGNNEMSLVSVGTPVVMIERLLMKSKAGRPSMYSVPPKKRHYHP